MEQMLELQKDKIIAILMIFHFSAELEKYLRSELKVATVMV